MKYDSFLYKITLYDCMVTIYSNSIHLTPNTYEFDIEDNIAYFCVIVCSVCNFR